MDKAKAVLDGAWSLAAEGYHVCTDWIERNPQWVFWGALIYLVVRR